jgi:hypothetical protein
VQHCTSVSFLLRLPPAQEALSEGNSNAHSIIGTMGSSSGNQPWITFLSSVFGFPESTSCLDTDSEWALAYYLGSMMFSCFAGYICDVLFFFRSRYASRPLLFIDFEVPSPPGTHGHPSDLF